MKKTEKTDKIDTLTLLSLKRKEIVEAKAKQFLGNLKDTSVFRKLRREIARLSTSLTKTK